MVLDLRPKLDAETHSPALAALDLALAEFTGTHPGVVVSRDVRPVHPQRLLADASEHAALLVVGSRGRSVLVAMLLGSVSQSMLQHASCPVAVAR